MGITRTDFLFAAPTIIGGAATVFSVAGLRNEYNKSQTPEQADYIAVASDWQVIGGDIKKATDIAEKKRLGVPSKKK